MSCLAKASELLFLCEWRAQTLSGDGVILKYLVLYFVKVVATVQQTILNVSF